ncbi:MAG: MFS transporter [Devosia sp.]|uniref:MFS transporter n=1 Tax=Devosia sp. TaxID=1871048 RepID=UPI0033910D43
MTRPSNRIGLIFALLAAGAASISMLQSLLSPVLSTLQSELDTSQNAISWVLIAFLLAGAVATPILGRVGDTVGKVRTLLIALGAMIVGNVISGFAPNIEVMVLGRAVQGIGMSAFPLSFGIIRDEFPANRLASAVGTMSSVIAVGGGIGAVLAGPIVSMLGWRWLFWLPTVALVVVAILVRRFIPESPVRSGGRINWLAATLLGGWLIALLLPLSQATQWGWTSPAVIGLLAGAAILAAIWVVVETRSDNPLIDMQVMRLPAVWTTNLVALLFGAAMFSVWAFVPQLIQVPASSGYGFGASVTQAGWIILPMLVTMALAGTLVGRLEKRFSFKSQLSMGAALVSLACAGFAFLHHDIWQLTLTSAVFGLGLGLAYSTMTNIIVQSVPPTQTGVATGMNANIRTIGGAMGTTIMTAIVTAHRQPDGMPVEEGFVTGFATFAVVALIAFLVTRLLPNPRPLVLAEAA